MKETTRLLLILCATSLLAAVAHAETPPGCGLPVQSEEFLTPVMVDATGRVLGEYLQDRTGQISSSIVVSFSGLEGMYAAYVSTRYNHIRPITDGETVYTDSADCSGTFVIQDYQFPSPMKSLHETDCGYFVADVSASKLSSFMPALAWVYAGAGQNFGVWASRTDEINDVYPAVQVSFEPPVFPVHVEKR